jgi:hypothetical protein
MKSILILDAYVTDDADETLLNNFIESSKSIGDNVLLMSNTNISKTTQDKVDYFFYDKRNQLFSEEYSKYEYVNYWTRYDWFKVSNCFPHTQNHGLSVLISLFRSVRIAKELGYTHFYKMEYDARITEKTKIKIKDLNNECVLNNKKGVFFVEKEGNTENLSMSVHYFFCEIDYFLNNFWNVTCEQDYINFLETEFGNRDFLIMERFMYENVKKLNHDEIYVKDGFSTEFDSTLWNMKQTRIYNDKKYKECLTKFYLKKDHPDEVVIYSKNVKSKPDFRRIVVKFNDGGEREIIQEFGGYGDWSYTVLPNNIEKMMIYDKDGLFLYEDYFKNIINEIEFY